MSGSWRNQRTHGDMDMPNYGNTRDADINDTKVNKVAYKRTSLAAREFAKRKGISPIKTTKALSEAVRSHVDHTYGLGSQGQAQVTRGLTGLASRLQDGNRSGRMSKDGNYYTSKGGMIESFGQYLANETVNRGTPYPVLRPKTPKGTLKAGKTVANIIKTIR